MKAKSWIKKITEQTEALGTYKKEFASVIASLADILEVRDTAKEQFDASGGKVMVTRIDSNGNTKEVIHPALAEWERLNSLALNYWKELGLTPQGLKKIDESLMKPKRKSAFAGLLD